MPSWNDEQRSDLLAKYRRSGLTQDAFCAELRAQGIDLSPRTLRTWIARLEPPEGVVEACLRAVDLAMSELRRVRAMLSAARRAPEDQTSDATRQVPVEERSSAENRVQEGIPPPPAAEPAVKASPSVTQPSVPDGMPGFDPPRKAGRLRWG